MGKSKVKPPKNGHTGKGKVKEEEEHLVSEVLLLEPILTMTWHSWIAFGIFVGVYLKCTSASIPSGDAGDFIIAAQHFGVAHPPGYPLYVTVGYLWMKLLPFGNPAFKLNLLTSFIGGLAAFIVYLTTFKITNFIPSAMFASGVFGFSHLIWFHSVGSEIFSLNNAFCGLLLYWVVRFEHAAVSNRAQVAIEASFLSGLSMCNQHTSGLFIAVIGAWMFISLIKDKAISIKQFIHTGIAFGIALTPYIQLPVSAHFFDVPSTWGDSRTFLGFWKHITREEYGTFRLTADDRPSDPIGNLGTYTSDLVHELGNITFALGVLCLLSAWKFPKIRNIVYVYFGTMSLYIMFFCNQANVDHSRELMKGVLERFWMQSNIPVSILAGCGVWIIYSVVTQYVRCLDKVLVVGLALGAALVGAFQIRDNYGICDMSNNLIMRDYGRKLLDAVPPNGVLMVEGDMPSLTSRYLRYCEAYRTDVDVVDQELIGFPWFKPMHKHNFKHYVFPYDREVYFHSVLAHKGANTPFTYDFKTLFDVHTSAGIPLYIYPYMKHSDEEWKTYYSLLPTTMVYEVRSLNTPYTMAEFLDKAENHDYNFNPNMDYCDNTLYPIRSWEYVIADSCSHTAFFPPEYAHRLLTSDGAAYMNPGNIPVMIRTIQLYKRARDTLTLNGKQMYARQHAKNYGVMSYLAYSNFMRQGKRQEAGIYARTMAEQWDDYLNRPLMTSSPSSDDVLLWGDVTPEERANFLSVIEDAKAKIPDLMTNEAYILK